jgi:uncharacterized protein YuzE
MAKGVSLAIDAPKVVAAVAEQYHLDLPQKIVMLHYDKEADTLYVHFEYPSRTVNSDVMDEHGEIILGLVEEARPANLTVINASRFLH